MDLKEEEQKYLLMSFIYLFGCSSDTYGHDLEGFRNDMGVLFDCRVDPPFVGYVPIFCSWLLVNH